MNLGEILLSALTGPLTSVGQDQLVQLFDKLYEKNNETYKSALVALYPIVDIQLESLTSKSKTKIDDAIINALKGAIEESAAKYKLVLSNLDND